jgi:hypothetical protein
MYYFGIFSSHIPYILFTVVYMVYFGMNTLNKPKNSEAFSDTTENLIQKSDIQSKELATLLKSYVANPRDFSNSFMKDNHLQLVIEENSSSKNFHPDISVQTVYFSFSVFSRPPPYHS